MEIAGVFDHDLDAGPHMLGPGHVPGDGVRDGRDRPSPEGADLAGLGNQRRQRAGHESAALGHCLIGDEIGLVPDGPMDDHEFCLGKGLRHPGRGLRVYEHMGVDQVIPGLGEFSQGRFGFGRIHILLMAGLKSIFLGRFPERPVPGRAPTIVADRPRNDQTDLFQFSRVPKAREQ